jgi:hypothetical protein
MMNPHSVYYTVSNHKEQAMNYKQAKQKIIVKRVVGLFVGTPALVSTVVSLLKMLYFRVDDGSQLGGIISRPLKILVSWAYENTQQYIGWFWRHSPTPDIANIWSPENGYFLAIYFLIFIGMAFWASGGKLANRLRDINKKIEDLVIEESIRGEKARSREQIQMETVIPSNSVFSQFHQLYLAPMIVGIILAALVKLMNL